jgi:ribonucleoside-diphosphate reductase alpha chain
MPVEEQVSLLEAEQESADAVQEAEKPAKEHSVNEHSPAVSEAPALVTADAKATTSDSTAPLCYNCGNQTQRAGSCYVCSSCGSTTGCS